MWAFDIDRADLELDDVCVAELLGAAARKFGVVGRVQFCSCEDGNIAGASFVVCGHGEEGDEEEEEDAYDGDSLAVVGPDSSGATVDMRWRVELRGFPGRLFRMGQCDVCRAVWFYEEGGE